MSQKSQLEQLNAKMSACCRCALRSDCTQVVPGSGNPKAEIMFIGEAPGENEDKLGIPFVGSTGRILDKILSDIKVNRGDVYLTNICKCRPIKNRDPLPEELASCSSWLQNQIEIIKPEIIVTLGRYALNYFLPETKISEVHGKILKINDSKIGKINLYPIHHPAAARINRKTKAIFIEDFQKLPFVLEQIKKER